MKADLKNGNMPDAGSSASSRIDRLVDAHRDLLQRPDGARLAQDIQDRLAHPWFVDLPALLAKRLPLASRVWRCAKRWFWRLMLVYIMYAAVSATVNFYFDKQLDAWYRSDAYTDVSLRWNFALRKLAVWTGTPRMDAVQELAGGECVLGNPVYRKPLMCCNCKFNVTLSKVTDVQKVMENFDKLVTLGKPRSFIIINHIQKPVSYQTIRETALANAADIQLGYNQFVRLSGPRVSSLQELFANEAAPPAASAITWQFGHVEALRHFRALIARPHFVSRDLEINLMRAFLFFGAEHTEKVPLGSLTEFEGQVYIVGLAGEIVFTVKSNPDCCKKAENRVTRFATLRPGRLLSLPSSCYEVQARRNGTEPAMAYIGSVAMAQHPAAERSKPKK